MTKTGFSAVAALLVAAVAIAVWRPGTDEAPSSATVPGGGLAEVSLPADLSSEARIGQTAFAAKCAECHGAKAEGVDGKGPPLVHRYYEPSHHGDAALLNAARNGVRAHHWPFGDMPPVEGLTDAEIGAITRFVREVQKRNGIF